MFSYFIILLLWNSNTHQRLTDSDPESHIPVLSLIMSLKSPYLSPYLELKPMDFLDLLYNCVQC